MTKKHFQAIADAIRPYAQSYVAIDIAKTLARVLHDDNPRFQRARFLKACGIDQPKT
jgi:hypothetical protein